jgi:DNA-binding MarR family transcriptional regulator
MNSPLTEQFIEHMTPALELFEGAKAEEVPATSPTLEQSIMCHILLIETVMMRLANRICEAHDLTFTQWMALSCISHEGKIGITHSDLSRRLMLSKAPITAIVDRLESAKMVRRVADKSDRRVSRVVITAKGLKQWNQTRLAMNTYDEKLFCGLTQSKKEMLLPSLAHLLNAAAQDDPILCVSLDEKDS